MSTDELSDSEGVLADVDFSFVSHRSSTSSLDDAAIPCSNNTQHFSVADGHTDHDADSDHSTA